MKKVLWWIVAIVLVVLAIVFSMKKSDNGGAYGSPSPSPSDMSASPTATGNPYVSGIGTSSNKTYTALVAQYGTNRIQFDALCQAIPSAPVFKTGTYVMFDNRSGDARTITIGGTKYYFPGYGYHVIKLGSTKLPATVKLDCGSAINVGTITVEK